MLASMLRQSSGGGGGGSGSRLSRLSSSSVASTGPAGPTKRASVGSSSLDHPVSDPNYIMQLVGDVRKFADVLLQLKEVFNSNGRFGESGKTQTFIVVYSNLMLRMTLRVSTIVDMQSSSKFD